MHFFINADLQAQNAIPSNDMVITQNSLIFLEDEGQTINSLEERKVNVTVEDPKPDEVLPIVVIIFSNDGTTEYGPYTVSETNPLEVDITGGGWGVQVISYTEGSELSVWID